MRLFAILRVIGVFLSASSLFGLLMFWTTNNPASAGVPLALLILSLVSTSKLKSYPWLLVTITILVIVSYSIAGMPFLNTRDDIIARLLHFAELLLICVFILQSFIKSPKNVPEQDTAVTVFNTIGKAKEKTELKP